MAKDKVKDPYRSLTKIMIVLLVFAVLLASGWFLLDQYNKASWRTLRLRLMPKTKAYSGLRAKIAEQKQQLNQRQVVKFPPQK